VARRPVGHEERLTLVEHLSELRSRVFFSLFAFIVALILCFWQNHALLGIMNRPLDGKDPLTFGVAEPFTTTLTVSAYFAILISLPVLLYQLYAFVLPAFSPQERKVAMPLLLTVPFLFVAGAVFAYFMVIPAALDFLLAFNADEFRTEIRARDYYSFSLLTMIVLGLLFQLPIGVLGAVRMGITTPQKLRKNRRYAILACAVVAALLPGVDPVTMLLMMVPLVGLYELSILLTRAFGRPAEDADEADAPDPLAPAEGS
jgi:sec-independent protein translocase protein TatC